MANLNASNSSNTVVTRIPAQIGGNPTVSLSATTILADLGFKDKQIASVLANPQHEKALEALFNGAPGEVAPLTFAFGGIVPTPDASLPPHMDSLAEALARNAPRKALPLLAAALACNPDAPMNAKIFAAFAEARLSAPDVALGTTAEKAFQIELRAQFADHNIPLHVKQTWVPLLKYHGADLGNRLDKVPYPTAARGASPSASETLKHSQVLVGQFYEALAKNDDEMMDNVLKKLSRWSKDEAKICQKERSSEASKSKLPSSAKAGNSSSMQDAMKVLTVPPKSRDLLGGIDKRSQELATAIKGHDQPKIEKLLKGPEGIQLINAKLPPGGWTPLALAVSSGDEHAVAFFLSCPGVELNARCPGTAESQQQADAHGPKGEVRDATPLSLAARHGHDGVVRLLLKKPGVEVTAVNAAGVSPFFEALANGKVSVVKEFTSDSRIDINKKNQQGQTPLCLATELGHPEIIKELLSNPKVEVSKPGKNGLTPLHFAVAHSNPQVFQAFASHPSISQTANAKDKWKITPLEMAARCGADPEKVIKPLQKMTKASPVSSASVPSTDYSKGLLVGGSGSSSQTADLNKVAKAGGVDLQGSGDDVQNMSWEALKKLPVQKGAFAMIAGEATWDDALKCHMTKLGSGEVVPTSAIIRVLAEKGVRDITFFVNSGGRAVEGLARQLNGDPGWPASLNSNLKITFVGGDSWNSSASSNYDMENRLKDFAAAQEGEQGTSMEHNTVGSMATLTWSPTAGRVVASSRNPPGESERGTLSAKEKEKVLCHQLLDHAYQGNYAKLRTMLADPAVDYHALLGGEILAAAAAGGHLETVELLLQQDKIGINNKNGVSALSVAAQSNHPAVVDRLVKHSEIRVNDGLPLLAAAKAGHTDVVDILVKHPDINVNGHLDDGGAPLLAAAENGHVEVVAVLLRHPKIDLNKANTAGDTPLSVAVKNGHGEVVKLLLANQARLTPDFDKAIKIAIENQHHDIAEMLQEASKGWYQSIGDVEKQDRRAVRDLLYGSDEGDTASVERALQYPGIQINKEQGDGITPLFAAAQKGHTGVVGVLLKEPGIQINKAAKGGVTPLHQATEQGHSSVVELLVKQPGILINTTNEKGATPLNVAVRNGKADAFDALIKRPEIEVNKPDNTGATPLHTAALKNRRSMTKALVEHPKIDVNKQDKTGATPMHAAAEAGFSRPVEELLKHSKIQINKQDNTGATPLYVAAAAGKIKVVEALLTGGAEIEKRTKDGLTPLHIAARNNEIDVVRALLLNGAGRLDSAIEIARKKGHTEVVELLTATKKERGFVGLDDGAHTSDEEEQDMVELDDV
ncbi:MAG: ankyrin repeat domain-containing protein [Verrucomicrobium sp.]